jgi:hypothetical protein
VRGAADHHRPAGRAYPWFNNVETVTAEKIGIETTTYVRNICKYYVSYKLAVESGATAAKVRQQVAPGK